MSEIFLIIAKSSSKDRLQSSNPSCLEVQSNKEVNRGSSHEERQEWHNYVSPNAATENKGNVIAKQETEKD